MPIQSFIIGINGYIASRAAVFLRNSGCLVRTVSSRPGGGEFELDLRIPRDFPYKAILEDDVVVLSAAISSPDVCAGQLELARQINVTGTGEFIQGCLGRGAKVAFLSSDLIYGPSIAERDEKAEPNPFGDYALMKRAIETRFSSYSTFKVLRLSYVFSRNDKFTSYLSACVNENRVAEVFHPIYRCVVYIEDLLDLLRLVCIDWNSVPARILNICGPELLSRVDMANLFEETVSNKLKYRTVEPPADFFLLRPKVINMSNRTFERALGRPVRNLKDAIRLEFHGGAR